MKKLLLGTAALLLAASTASAHPDHADDTVASRDQVGTEQMVMQTSANEAAQAPFLEGLALLHNFEYDRAAAAFVRAQQADPGFVMAYWGEAMTHNHPLWAEQDYDAAHAALAKLGATPEARAAKARTASERQWLGALEALYGEGTKEDRDFAYLAKMRALLESEPSDIDARAFTGLAILGTSHGGRQIPIYMEAAGLLEPGFMTHEMHPGILHYLIHSYDDPVHAPLGERMAERYAVVAPGAGHAQHMVSHIFYALADWEATEAANIKASGVVNRLRAAAGRPESSCGHYNEWLAYSLLQQGKDARELIGSCHAQVAATAAEDAETRDEDDASALRGAWSATRMAIFLGVDGGEWLEPLSIPANEANASARFQQAHGQLLRWWSGDRSALMGQAHAAIATMKTVFGEVPEADREYASWGERAIARSEALMKIAHGQKEAGMAALEEAAAAELAMPVVFGPPVIFKPSYEILGEMHLAAGGKDEAVQAFTKSLELAPGRRLSIEGLKQANSL